MPHDVSLRLLLAKASLTPDEPGESGGGAEVRSNGTRATPFGSIDHLKQAMAAGMQRN